MTISPDYALVGLIIKELKDRGSWCGETHIQKAAFVAKEAMGVPLSTSFVLYKHGPYSFDLNSTLASMRADRVLALIPQGQYGPSLALERAAESVFERFKSNINESASKIKFVAAAFATKNVVELERVTTAIYVKLKRPQDSPEARAAELNRLKPHIDLLTALSSVNEADQFLEKVKSI